MRQLEPMRRQVERQVERRTGRKVGEHLADGGYLTFEDVEKAAARGLRGAARGWRGCAGVTLYLPPSRARPGEVRQRIRAARPTAGRSAAWRERMGTEEAKAVYKQRASTVETVNADLETHRGLVQLAVRGLAKARCVPRVVRRGVQPDALRRPAGRVKGESEGRK